MPTGSMPVLCGRMCPLMVLLVNTLADLFALESLEQVHELGIVSTRECLVCYGKEPVVFLIDVDT